MKRLILIMIVAFGLSGCDPQKNSIQEPAALVISPGYKVKVGGIAVPIFGSDDCFPANKNKTTLRSTQGEDSHSCIVITKKTKTVAVVIGLANGVTHENWNVVHSDESILLQRADGTYIEFLNS